MVKFAILTAIWHQINRFSIKTVGTGKCFTSRIRDPGQAIKMGIEVHYNTFDGINKVAR
jgi:hypothetical protein